MQATREQLRQARSQVKAARRAMRRGRTNRFLTDGARMELERGLTRANSLVRGIDRSRLN